MSLSMFQQHIYCLISELILCQIQRLYTLTLKNCLQQNAQPLITDFIFPQFQSLQSRILFYQFTNLNQLRIAHFRACQIRAFCCASSQILHLLVEFFRQFYQNRFAPLCIVQKLARQLCCIAQVNA